MLNVAYNVYSVCTLWQLYNKPYTMWGWINLIFNLGHGWLSYAPKFSLELWYNWLAENYRLSAFIRIQLYSINNAENFCILLICLVPSIYFLHLMESCPRHIILKFMCFTDEKVECNLFVTHFLPYSSCPESCLSSFLQTPTLTHLQNSL